MASRALVGALIAMLIPAPARSGVPDGVVRQLPPGYDVLGSASMRVGSPVRTVVIVALGRRGESDGAHGEARAPARPLMVFARGPDGRFSRLGRNDTVVDRADEGGQCDPFLDGGGVIAARGRLFTVQNSVACGQHWTDYITFRFEPAVGGFVFDNEQSESWRLNPSDDPGADALVRDGPHYTRRADPSHPIGFNAWRPAR